MAPGPESLGHGVGPWSSGHGPRIMILGVWFPDQRLYAMVLGPWSMDYGSRTMVLGPWSLDQGPWAMFPGLWSLGHCPTALCRENGQGLVAKTKRGMVGSFQTPPPPMLPISQWTPSAEASLGQNSSTDLSSKLSKGDCLLSPQNIALHAHYRPSPHPL